MSFHGLYSFYFLGLEIKTETNSLLEEVENLEID